MSKIDKAIPIVGDIAEDFVALHAAVAEHPAIAEIVDRIHLNLNRLLSMAAGIFGVRIKQVAVARSGGVDKP